MFVRCRPSFLLLPITLAVSLVGCKTNEGYRWGAGLQQPAAVVSQRSHTTPVCQANRSTIQPGPYFGHVVITGFEPAPVSPWGHSLLRNDKTDLTPGAQMRYPIPPHPVSLRDEGSSRQSKPDNRPGDAPAPSKTDLERLNSVSPEDGGQQIREQEAPDLLSPWNMRSIYEKFRLTPSEQKNQQQGPIRFLRPSVSSTHTSQKKGASDSSLVVQPVALGLPESDLSGDGCSSTTSAEPVMQACPSAFRRPQWTDPEGARSGQQD